MNIRIVHFIWIIGLIFYLPELAQAHLLRDEEVRSKVYLTKEQALKLSFPEEDKVVIQNIWLDQNHKKFISDLTGENFNKGRQKVYAGKKGKKTTGLAMFDQINIPNQHPIIFKYMVLFQPEGKIKKVVILEYQGLQRDEIVSEEFLSQFNGKDANSDFQKVDSSQGMTIAVQVLTKEVLKLAAIFHIYLENLKN